MYRDAFQFAHLELQINITFIFEMYICAHGYAVDFTYGDNGYKCCRPVYIQVCTVDKKVYTPLLKW